MSKETNKETERRMVAEALNKGNLEILGECLTEDFIYHGPGGTEVKGIEGYRQFLSALLTASPDMHVEIKDILAEGDLAATRTLCTFTSRQPETRHIAMAGSILDRFKGGKIAETWEMYDRLDLYQQMGVIPVKPT